MAEVTPTFTLMGCRELVLPSESRFEAHMTALEESVGVGPEFTFDLAKSFVESVCKTILADLGLPADPNWDAPKILSETTNRLQLLPTGHPKPKEGRDALVKATRGLLQTIQGLCELRNLYGTSSHGKDIADARLEQRQAWLAAQAADTIAAFLFRTHRDALRQSPGVRVYYDDHPEFNAWIDDQYDPIAIGEESILASRALYHAATDSYRAALIDYLANPSEEQSEEAPI
ncbi:MAG TPA: abortive infection family protein [Fimbriimonadaceae bacterium]|nr:abortive infection family protein [Fimbriimonadaceae bacterium]